MKKFSLFLVLLFGVVSLFADMKRYEIKSAQIEYQILGTGNVMGVPTKISGTSSLLFKDYGNIEIAHENFSQNIMGQKQVTEDITKLEGNVVYSVDLEDKIIYKQSIPLDSDDPALSLKGKKALSSLGGKRIGMGKVLEYDCEIWELSGIKMWIYKSVPLKTETTIMGIKQTQVANKIKFNISISDDKFKLPNYPIKTRVDMMSENKKQLEEEMKNMTPEQRKMMQDMMKNMGGMFGGKE